MIKTKTTIKPKPRMRREYVSQKGKLKRLKMEVISHVREVMEARGITGYQMAIDLTITNQFIYSHIMKPGYAPGIATALVLAEYLKTPINKLFEIKK